MKKFILLSLLVITQVLGDILLSQGMKHFDVNLSSFAGFLSLIIHLFTNINIWLGVGCLATSLALYLTSISKYEFSYVLPILASNYVLNAVFAWAILHEKISVIRWLGTLLVSMGVLIISYSEKKPELQKKEKEPISINSKSSFWFYLPVGFSLGISKTWLAIATIVLTDSAGDLLLAKGMKKVGEVKIKSVKQVLKMIKQIITNTFIISGVICQATGLIVFVSALSWADISLVRPATSLGYIVSMIGAKYILHETIKPIRLIGTIIIGIGVAFLSMT